MFQFVAAALAVNVAVLASLGPIVAFFSVSTTSYSFIFLLNVLVFVVSGVLGGAFLLQTLDRWGVARHVPLPPALQPAPPPAEPLSATEETEPGSAERQSQEQATPIMARLVEETDTLPRARSRVRPAFADRFHILADRFWTGLRPDGLGAAAFFGKASRVLPLVLLRESNFLAAFWDALRGLFS